jgi:hypothetical protein
LVKTSGSDIQVYNGSVTLGADATLTMVSGNSIALNAPVDGAHSLTINNTGATTIATVGGTTPVTSLTATGGPLSVGAVTSTGKISLTTTSGDLTLSNNLTASGQTITLDSAGAITRPPDLTADVGDRRGRGRSA